MSPIKDFSENLTPIGDRHAKMSLPSLSRKSTAMRRARQFHSEADNLDALRGSNPIEEDRGKSLNRSANPINFLRKGAPAPSYPNVVKGERPKRAIIKQFAW